MGDLGEMLKAAREAKGVSLPEAEEETKIRKRYLEAMENEEYNIIPGGIYARGFLKTYASYLGLDQDEVMTAFKMLNISAEAPPPRRTTSTQVKYKSYAQGRRRKKFKWKPSFLTIMLATAAVVTLLVFNNLWNNDDGSAINQTKNNSAATTAAKPPAPKKQPSVPAADYNSGNSQQQEPNTAVLTPAPGKQLNLVLSIKEQESWVRVVADGVQKYSGTMTPGQVQNFNADDKILVRLGNAGAVELNYNGQSLGVLGPLGTVMEREFSRVSTVVYSSSN